MSFLQSTKTTRQKGFTMIEMIIGVTLVGLLAIAALLGTRLQILRARDTERKGHLEKLRVAFEEYYNDNDCYPPADVFFNGGSGPDPSLCDRPLEELTPYLSTVPCDPDTGRPYVYYPAVGGTVCDGYRLYTRLENTNDPGIEKVGCTKEACGLQTGYNYGIAVGTDLAQSDSDATVPTPTPTPVYGMPTGFVGNWACSPNGDININGGDPYCKQYLPVTGHGCGAATATEIECAGFCYVGSPIMCSD